MCLGTWGHGDEPGTGEELVPQGCCSPLPGEMERQHSPELCCGRSKRGTVPVAGSVFPPAVRFTPERPFLNMLSLAPVRCALKMMPEVMPRSDPDRQRGETDCLLVP